MTLGEAIRILRQKTLFTQQDFAQELNVALSTVNRWELNKAKPNMKAMKSIRVFCNENGLDYEIIENEWMNLNSKNTDGKNR